MNLADYLPIAIMFVLVVVFAGISIGLGISLPMETTANPFITRELAFEFHYFFTRKFWFVYLAKALVVFPGGFGTMDELFELLTLVQTHSCGRSATPASLTMCLIFRKTSLAELQRLSTSC